MSKHTPAPWRVRGFQVVNVVPNFNGPGVLEYVISPKSDFDPKTAKANAHLMAAAPEMLEALDVALNVITRLMETNAEKIMWNEVIQIKEAIYKARGGSR